MFKNGMTLVCRSRLLFTEAKLISLIIVLNVRSWPSTVATESVRATIKFGLSVTFSSVQTTRLFVRCLATWMVVLKSCTGTSTACFGHVTRNQLQRQRQDRQPLRCQLQPLLAQLLIAQHWLVSCQLQSTLWLCSLPFAASRISWSKESEQADDKVEGLQLMKNVISWLRYQHLKLENHRHLLHPYQAQHRHHLHRSFQHHRVVQAMMCH